MPSLTDGAIRRAIKKVEKSGKQTSLADGEGRGTGRLVLVLKAMPTRVTAEWMAQQWRGFEVHCKCFETGALVRYTGDIIAMSPPLIIEKSQIDELISVLADAIKQVK